MNANLKDARKVDRVMGFLTSRVYICFSVFAIIQIRVHSR